MLVLLSDRIEAGISLLYWLVRRKAISEIATGKKTASWFSDSSLLFCFNPGALTLAVLFVLTLFILQSLQSRKCVEKLHCDYQLSIC